MKSGGNYGREIREKLKENKQEVDLTKIYDIHMISCQEIKNKNKEEEVWNQDMSIIHTKT